MSWRWSCRRTKDKYATKSREAGGWDGQARHSGRVCVCNKDEVVLGQPMDRYINNQTLNQPYQCYTGKPQPRI